VKNWEWAFLLGNSEALGATRMRSTHSKSPLLQAMCRGLLPDRSRMDACRAGKEPKLDKLFSALLIVWKSSYKQTKRFFLLSLTSNTDRHKKIAEKTGVFVLHVLEVIGQVFFFFD
jgi:hypothetical protein